MSVSVGSGAFGKVGMFRYHGAAVAVKELKADANEDSIGKSCLAVPTGWREGPEQLTVFAILRARL